jgi:hypothetical protein
VTMYLLRVVVCLVLFNLMTLKQFISMCDMGHMRGEWKGQMNAHCFAVAVALEEVKTIVVAVVGLS